MIQLAMSIRVSLVQALNDFLGASVSGFLRFAGHSLVTENNHGWTPMDTDDGPERGCSPLVGLIFEIPADPCPLVLSCFAYLAYFAVITLFALIAALLPQAPSVVTNPCPGSKWNLLFVFSPAFRAFAIIDWLLSLGLGVGCRSAFHRAAQLAHLVTQEGGFFKFEIVSRG